TGFTLGGPGLKDKLFLFGGYQRTWLRTVAGDAQALTMPAPFPTGGFSSLLSPNPPIIIPDPLNGEPFPNNVIPTSRQSPAALALLKFSPLPGSDGFTRFSLFSKEDTDEQVIRGDYRPAVRHKFPGSLFPSGFP